MDLTLQLLAEGTAIASAAPLCRSHESRLRRQVDDRGRQNCVSRRAMTHSRVYTSKKRVCDAEVCENASGLMSWDQRPFFLLERRSCCACRKQIKPSVAHRRGHRRQPPERGPAPSASGQPSSSARAPLFLRRLSVVAPLLALGGGRVAAPSHRRARTGRASALAPRFGAGSPFASASARRASGGFVKSRSVPTSPPPVPELLVAADELGVFVELGCFFLRPGCGASRVK